MPLADLLRRHDPHHEFVRLSAEIDRLSTELLRRATELSHAEDYRAALAEIGRCQHEIERSQDEFVRRIELYRRQRFPLDQLCRRLQTLFPALYAQVLEPTLADIREEHSAALADGRCLKARCVLLRGCGALVAAGACQLGFSLLGHIEALWQARNSK